jgi:aminoglycoside phosphotransferase (APT) family kinase protein
LSLKDNTVKRGLLRLYQARSDRRLLPTEDVQIRDLAQISDGWENEVYAFAAEIGEAEDQTRQDLILRIYPGNDALQKSAHEFNVMKQLYAAGYPVPQVHLLETDGAYFGKPFVIMERIIGRPMGAIADRAPTETQLELLERFCRMQVDLHALDWRPFVPDPSAYEVQDHSSILARQFAEWQARVHALQIDAFDPVFEWLSVRLPEVRFGPPSLLHMDYHHYNVLVREADGAAFVIDWGSAMVADYRLDLAWTLLVMSGFGRPDLWDKVLAGYERAAGRRVEQFEVFSVIACTSRLFGILASLDLGADQVGMRPGAEAMIKNAAHISYVYALLCDQTGIAIPAVERLLSSLQ